MIDETEMEQPNWYSHPNNPCSTKSFADSDIICVGYENGKISIFDSRKSKKIITF